MSEFHAVDLRDREAIDKLIAEVGKVDKLFYSAGPTNTAMMQAFLGEVAEEFINNAYPSPFGRLSTPEEQAWPF